MNKYIQIQQTLLAIHKSIISKMITQIVLAHIFAIINCSLCTNLDIMKTYYDQETTNLECAEQEFNGSMLYCSSLCTPQRHSNPCIAIRKTGAESCGVCYPCGKQKQNWTDSYLIIRFDSTRDELIKG